MADMHSEALGVVRQGSKSDDLSETRQAYMRYVGQGHEIAVDLPVEIYGETHIDVFREAFEAAYTRLYGRTIDGIDVEVLSWTLTISAPPADVAAAPDESGSSAVPDAIARQSFFDPVSEDRIDVPVYLRSDLAPGTHIVGPALITEDQTTTVVTSSFDATIDSRHCIVLTRRSTP
jgi:N-methylhydantoinase A